MTIGAVALGAVIFFIILSLYALLAVSAQSSQTLARQEAELERAWQEAEREAAHNDVYARRFKGGV